MHTYMYCQCTYNMFYHIMIIPEFLDILCLASSGLAVGLCSLHTIDAVINASPVNEYSSIKLQLCYLQIVTMMHSTMHGM